MIGPSNPERLFSLFLALSIQVGIGLALFSVADIGEPRFGGDERARGSVLVVELIPLNRVGNPDSSSDPGASLAAVPSTGEPIGANHKKADIAGADRGPSADSASSPSRGAQTTSTPVMTDFASADALAWRARVQSHLSRYRLYPPGAASGGQQGFALVQFTVGRDGTVTDAWIASSSGIADIDRETIAAILRAQPLPPFPAGWPDKLDVSLPVAFRLS